MQSRKSILTKNGYELLEIASTLQKSIRRGDVRIATWTALELYHSGFWLYAWKRLYTVSAEDCEALITKEIHALFNGFLLVNEGRRDLDKGRIFLTKAVITLCRYPKNRDADHAQNLMYDNIFDTSLVSDSDIREAIEEARGEVIQIPDYAFDCHTKKGRMMKKTKFDFFIDEFIGMENRTTGLFDSEMKRVIDKSRAYDH